MSEQRLRLVGAALSALGIALTSYLLYARGTGTPLACSTGGCTTVQSSSYAELLGLPVAALGLGAYAALLVAALARGELARLVQASVSLAAVAFSGYLLYVQLGVLDALCQWCIANDALFGGIAVVALLRLRS